MRAIRLAPVAVLTIAFGLSISNASADERAELLDRSEPLLAVLEENDCSLSLDDTDRALTDLGLSRQEADALTIALLNEGIVVVGDGERLYLASGSECESVPVPAVSADPTVVAAVVQFFEERECATSLDDGPIKALRGQYERQTLTDAVMFLTSQRAFKFDADTVHYIAGPICSQFAE